MATGLSRQRIFVVATAIAIASTMAAGCTANTSPSQGQSQTIQTPGPTTTSADPTPAPTSLAVMFVGLPEKPCLSFDAPLELNLKIVNGNTTDYPRLGWLIASDQLAAGGVGPGLLGAQLERQDATTGTWTEGQLQQKHDEQAWLTQDLPSVHLAKNMSIEAKYRLTLWGIGGDGGTTTVRAFLVDLDQHAKVAEATTPLCVVKHLASSPSA